jgi:N-acetylneuraminate synthase
LYKIASPQTRAFPQLIRAAAETGKPLIISTGYCRDEHVKRAVRICEETQNFRYILLQCTSQYPVKPEDVNLSVMDEFRKYGGPVGLSDHSKGIHMAVAAVARGANVIEKHFSLDPQGAGPDDVVSLNPQEFTMMVEHIRDTEKAIGTRNKRVLQEEEAIIETDHLLYRVVAARDLTVGETLNGNVIYKRAPGGITAEEEQDWTGKKLVRDVKKGAILQWTDLEP